jgi:hypothetical protein
MRPKPILVSLLAALALLASACGGSVGSSSGGDASGIAPADSLAFISIDTDLGSSQWKALDQLTNKFPIKSKVLRDIRQSMQKQGIDWSKDVKPALGDELDVAVLGASVSGTDAVGMTKPKDESKFESLLKKLDDSSTPKTTTLHEQVDGWTVFSDKQSAIDAVKQAAKNGHGLSDVTAFNDAMGAVSEDSLAKAYVNGGVLGKLMSSSTPLTAARKTPRLDWLAARLTASSSSLELYGSVHGDTSKLHVYKPQLLADVPSGALVYVSWRDLASLQSTGLGGAGSLPYEYFRSYLGITPPQFAALFRGEGAFWIAPGAPIPEFALELKPANPTQARATVRKLAHAIARLSRQPLKMRGSVPTLTFGPVNVMFAVSHGRVVVSNSTRALRPTGPSLASDPSFEQALKDAGAPARTAGLLYVNLKDAVPLLAGFSALGGGPQLTPDEQSSLDALRYLVAYGTVSGSTASSKIFFESK